MPSGVMDGVVRAMLLRKEDAGRGDEKLGGKPGTVSVLALLCLLLCFAVHFLQVQSLCCR